MSGSYFVTIACATNHFCGIHYNGMFAIVSSVILRLYCRTINGSPWLVYHEIIIVACTPHIYKTINFRCGSVSGKFKGCF